MFKFFTDHPKTSLLGIASILAAGSTVATSYANSQPVDWKTMILGLVVGLVGLFSADAKKDAPK